MRKAVGCKYRLVRTRPWMFIWFSCSVTEAISFRALGWRAQGLLKPKNKLKKNKTKKTTNQKKIDLANCPS